MSYFIIKLLTLYYKIGNITDDHAFHFKIFLQHFIVNTPSPSFPSYRYIHYQCKCSYKEILYLNVMVSTDSNIQLYWAIIEEVNLL